MLRQIFKRTNWNGPLYYAQHHGILFFLNNPSQNNDPVTDSDVRCWTNRKRKHYIPHSARRKVVIQLAYDPIAEGEVLRWNEAL